jgi:threonine aldolase
VNQQEKNRLALDCTRWLIGHPRMHATPQAILADLAAYTDPAVLSDIYGQGELINDFEKQVAELLGKPAAFMPSGTMAQQIALRLHADRSRVAHAHTPHVAFHPLCHLEIHEQKGYQLLHSLHGVLVGSPQRLMTLDDLKNIKEPLAALLLELPQREIGGQLPTWDELTAIVAWARERNIALHMDGARLWECQPFYQRSYTEIAGLFDTVYVSFYKILGGITGAMLLGSEDVIAEARIWQRQHGGNLVRMFPFVLSAKQGLETRLDRMAAYHAKAIEIAEVLAAFPEIEVTPNPPHTNMMHVFVRGEVDRLEEAALEIAQEQKIWLVNGWMPSQIPAYQKFELTVGDGALEFSAEELTELFQALIEKARGAN